MMVSYWVTKLDNCLAASLAVSLGNLMVATKVLLWVPSTEIWWAVLKVIQLVELMAYMKDLRMVERKERRSVVRLVVKKVYSKVGLKVDVMVCWKAVQLVYLLADRTDMSLVAKRESQLAAEWAESKVKSKDTEMENLKVVLWEHTSVDC